MEQQQSSPAEADVPAQDNTPAARSWTRQDTLVLCGLIVLALLIFLPALGSYGVLDPSDGLYTEASREMLERHDFLTPWSNYQPFYEKPILIYWAILSCYKLFGVCEWAARLPSALSGVFCVATLYTLSRRFISRRAALLSSLILLSSPLFAVVGHLCLTDMMLTWLMTCATLCLFGRWFSGGIALLVVAYLCLGLAVLAKGPVALVLVGASLLAYLFGRGRQSAAEKWYQMWWHRLWPLHPLAGLVLIFAIAAPWYIAEYNASHGEFFQEFFIRQNLGRAAGTVNHQQPWYYYIPYVLGGLFPWWLAFAMMPHLVARIWRRRKSNVRAQQLALLCLCWSILILGLFSAVRTKLGTYILPAFPPVALLAGILLDQGLRLAKMRKRLFALLLIPAIVAIAAVIALPIVFAKMHAVSLGTQCAFYSGATLLVSGFAGGAYRFRAGHCGQGFLIAALCAAMSLAFVIPAGLHQYDKIQHRPFRQLLQICLSDGANVAMFLRDSAAANYYLKRRLAYLGNGEEIDNFIREKPGKHYLLFTKDVMYLAKERIRHLRLVAQRGKWYIFQVD